MPIRLDRLQDDFAALSRITQTPGSGATRPTFSKEWGHAVAYVVEQAERVGCVVRRDAAGNVFARCGGLDADEPTWLVGSHLDTVPHGGDYDGVAGVLVGLELLRAAADEQATVPVELIIFAEEEGPTFGLGMLGSRALVGELDASALHALRNADGNDYINAGAAFGVSEPDLPAAKLRPDRHLGLIELHVEQGPGMWRRNERLAVVESIAGRLQYAATVSGEANHAGATAMADRRDALCAAAEMVTTLEALASELSPQAVITVGRLSVEPNAVNVIAESVAFTIDFRAPADDILESGDRLLRDRLSSIAERRGCAIELRQTEAITARPMSAALVGQLCQCCGDVPRVMSGALHDSAVLSPHLPTAMLFVPSRDGISHNPAEFSRVEDVAEAAAKVEQLVRRPALKRVNAMRRDAFVDTFGGIFEHSPWVAERAWERRPFPSVAALHEAMCDAVRQADEAQQLELVRAHPDLVGRLAAEGKLTADSAREQAAAGLDAVTPEQAALFARHNAAYREKFGFPFVICARENKKATILAEMPARLANDRNAELRTALAEIEKIARLRLADAVIDL